MSVYTLVESNGVPFRDLPQGLNDKIEPGGTRKRPWMAHWPPRPEHDTSMWANSDSPQVLSWRYSPQRPFDRPWRSWTRTPLAKQEMTSGLGQLLQPEARHFDTQTESSVERYDEIRPHSCTSGIDQERQNLEMGSAEIVELNYLAPLNLYRHEKPYLSRLPFIETLRRTNIATQMYPVNIYNISGKESDFELDVSGFSFTTFPFQFRIWNDDFVQAKYIPALTAWLKAHFQSPRVVIYAYNFRGNEMTKSDSGPWKSPFFRVHCDATAAACKQRLCLHDSLHSEEPATKRYRFINIWRPLTGPGQDCPLALCDTRSVCETDLVKSDIVFPHYCDEGYELMFNLAHRWFYKANMSTDEIIMFKLDDNSSNVAQFCPHSAFKNPKATEETPSRVSIEVRAIIIDGH